MRLNPIAHRIISMSNRIMIISIGEYSSFRHWSLTTAAALIFVRLFLVLPVVSKLVADYVNEEWNNMIAAYGMHFRFQSNIRLRWWSEPKLWAAKTKKFKGKWLVVDCTTFRFILMQSIPFYSIFVCEE